MNTLGNPSYEDYLSWYMDQRGEDVKNPYSFQSGMASRSIDGDQGNLVKAKLDYSFDSFMSRLDQFTAKGNQIPINITNCESLLIDVQWTKSPTNISLREDNRKNSMTESIQFINDISFTTPTIVTERVEVPIYSAPQPKVAKTNINTQPSTQIHSTSSSSSLNNKGRVSPPQGIYDLSEDEYSIPIQTKQSSNPTPTSAMSRTSSAPTAKPNPFQSAKDQYIKEGAKFPPKPQAQSQAQGGNGGGAKANKQSTLPPELERFDPELIERVEADIIQDGAQVEFKDIAGLEFAKKCVTEMIVWPMSRPDLFQGLRSLPKGLLLFGPPGTGKTLIGKAIAHQSGATFFCISSSSLTSKWIGEGEKTVRALFAVAAYRQPSVVFIDEVDSLLCQRSSDENEASRRMKTEFLVQLDGAGTDQTARVVIIGATNRPDELDEAARRRFVKRIYIPLPDFAGRKQLVERLLRDCPHSMSVEAIDELAEKTSGYSGADIRQLCTEAAMGPMRELAARCGNLSSIRASDVPGIDSRHFWEAFNAMAPSVSQADLQKYVEWNGTFGSFRRME